MPGSRGTSLKPASKNRRKTKPPDKKNEYRGEKAFMQVTRQSPNTNAFQHQTPSTPQPTNPKLGQPTVFRIPSIIQRANPVTFDSVLTVSSTVRSRSESPTPESPWNFFNVTKSDVKQRIESGLEPDYRYFTAPTEILLPVKRRITEPVQRPTPPKRLKLRPSKPIQNADQVNADIWSIILGMCEPKFLLEARTISSFFYRLLTDRPAIWRQSRANTYVGDDVPPCPPELTQSQFTDLLVGRGCQNSTCTNEKTSKVLWVFAVRLCPVCLKQKSMTLHAIPSDRKHLLPMLDGIGTFNLAELLPSAFGKSGKYLSIRRPRPLLSSITDRSENFLVMKRDYDQLEDEYLELKEKATSVVDILIWIQNQFDDLMDNYQEAKTLDEWHSTQPYTSKSYNVYYDRREMFNFKAFELDPPLTLDVLNKMAAYHDALKSANPPTERCWQTLKAKILPFREQAEKMVSMRTESAKREAAALFQRLQAHRSGRLLGIPSFKPEQEFVIKIGTQEFQKLVAANVDDEDLLLLTLQNTYLAFQEARDKPRALCYDGKSREYCLSLDDARMVVELVMERAIPRTTLRSASVFEKLKCMGCQRRDRKRWDFRTGLEHVLVVHGHRVGEGLEFWRWYVPFPRDWETDHQLYRFPWYTLPWPRCLPLVPRHYQFRNASLTWHPDLNFEYVQVQRPSLPSAFRNRRAVTGEDLAGDDLIDNMLHAATVLKDVQLDNLSQMKIILSYAVDLCRDKGVTPELSMLVESKPLLQAINASLEMKFRCGICVRGGQIGRSSRQVKFAVTIEALQVHWERDHLPDNDDWTTGLLYLPTDHQLSECISAADRLLQQEKNDTENRNANLSRQLRKRPRLKGSLILKTPFVREVFDQLFPIVDHDTSDS